MGQGGLHVVLDMHRSSVYMLFQALSCRPAALTHCQLPKGFLPATTSLGGVGGDAHAEMPTCALIMSVLCGMTEAMY